MCRPRTGGFWARWGPTALVSHTCDSIGRLSLRKVRPRGCLCLIAVPLEACFAESIGTNISGDLEFIRREVAENFYGGERALASGPGPSLLPGGYEVGHEMAEAELAPRRTLGKKIVSFSEATFGGLLSGLGSAVLGAPEGRPQGGDVTP